MLTRYGCVLTKLVIIPFMSGLSYMSIWGEEYLEVLGSILGDLKKIVNAIDMTKMTHPILWPIDLLTFTPYM